MVAPRNAASRSASANTMFGDLPPSSSVIVFSVSAALRMIALPVVVSPVNAILSMPGCSTSAWPTRRSGAGDDIQHARREARPRCAISPSASAVSGVWLAGLRMTVLPQASAGATFHAASSSGKFHGHDRGDNADRLAQRVGEVIALHRNRLAHAPCRPSRRSTRSTRPPPESRCAATR